MLIGRQLDSFLLDANKFIGIMSKIARIFVGVLFSIILLSIRVRPFTSESGSNFALPEFQTLFKPSKN